MTDGGLLRVLLVEDNDGDARLIQIALSETAAHHRSDVQFALERARRLGDAVSGARASAPDVALLDLNLPDSHGVESFSRLRGAVPDLPIVVLSGLGDEDVGAQCVREGAQDYLAKGSVDAPVLARALRFAVERRRAERERTERERAERLLDERERELAAYRRLASPAPAAVTGAAFGVRGLRLELPHRFAALVQRYGAMLDRALDDRGYRIVRHGGDPLRELADELGFLGAGPRDVIELHAAASGGRISSTNAKRAQAYVTEGRILVLALMGHLVAYYRR